MDLETEELKELIARNIKLSEDTNNLVHKLRRNQLWHTTFNVIWWLGVLGVTGTLYYYYLSPYVDQITGLYGTARNALESFRP